MQKEMNKILGYVIRFGCMGRERAVVSNDWCEYVYYVILRLSYSANGRTSIVNVTVATFSNALNETTRNVNGVNMVGWLVGLVMVVLSFGSAAAG